MRFSIECARSVSGRTFDNLPAEHMSVPALVGDESRDVVVVVVSSDAGTVVGLPPWFKPSGDFDVKKAAIDF